MTLEKLYSEGEQQIFYALCQCEDSGYVNVDWFRTKQDALWEGAMKYDHERYAIIRYNSVNGRWKLTNSFGDSFDLYLLITDRDNTPPLIPIIYGHALLPITDECYGLREWF